MLLHDGVTAAPFYLDSLSTKFSNEFFQKMEGEFFFKLVPDI